MEFVQIDIGKTGGVIDIVDYLGSDNHTIGIINQVSFDSQPVPEPATMLLFGAGLVGLVGARLRRKKN